MKSWLTLLSFCLLIAGCDGAAEEPDEKIPGAPPETGAEPLEEPGASPGPGTGEAPPSGGIGDGETGARPRSPTPSGARDAGAAGRPSGDHASTDDADDEGADFGGGTSRAPTKPGAAEPASGGKAPVSAGDTPSSGASGGATADDAPPVEGKPMVPAQPQSGTLTAGSWDDNLNFEHFQKYRKDPARAQRPGVLPLSDEELAAAHQAHSAAKSAHARLDVALVIDTTGSMGDEIRYLQSEFIGISQAIEAAYPGASQRWALVLYRDQGDDYVTRYFDFRDQPEAFREKLAAQAAGGGGDFPEAPEAALEVLNQFAWRSDPDVARIAFWVADAPHHNENAAKLAQALRTTKAQGIHLYPVASSGVDDLTELSMRTAAQLTGGRYLFLTDDSGVGGAHKEPTLPCYYVTKLNDALLRMVDLEMRGVYVAPDATKIVRTVGQPVNGTCTLQSGASDHAVLGSVFKRAVRRVRRRRGPLSLTWSSTAPATGSAAQNSSASPRRHGLV